MSASEKAGEWSLGLRDTIDVDECGAMETGCDDIGRGERQEGCGQVLINVTR